MSTPFWEIRRPRNLRFQCAPAEPFPNVGLIHFRIFRRIHTSKYIFFFFFLGSFGLKGSHISKKIKQNNRNRLGRDTLNTRVKFPRSLTVTRPYTVRCSEIENPTFRFGAVWSRNLAVRCGAVFSYCKSFGAVRCCDISCGAVRCSFAKKSYGAVPCGFEKNEILRCGSVLWYILRCGSVRLSEIRNPTVRCGFQIS